MPARRHFIQHIGGEPIALRYVKYDAKSNGPAIRQTPEGWVAEWTEDPAERNEWDAIGEVQEAKERIRIGIIRHTESDQPDPDIEVTRKHQPPPPEIPTEDDRPLTDDKLPWWLRS